MQIEIDGSSVVLCEFDGMLYSLKTNPENRRKGLARLVMKEAINIARKMELPVLRLFVAPFGAAPCSVEDLFNFYSSLGFEPDPEYANRSIIWMKLDLTGGNNA